MSEITIVIPDHTDEDGSDRIYVHGAEIDDPENNPNVTWDFSVEPPEAVYVLTVQPAETDEPYRAALTAVGVEVTGANGAGDWTGTQDRPLR